MLAKVAIAALAVTALAGPVSAERQIVAFVGHGFFPEVVYADPGDEIVLTNRHNGPISLALLGDAALAQNATETADETIVNLAEGEEFTFYSDGTNDEGGYEITMVITSATGTTQAAIPGVVSFDQDPDLGFGASAAQLEQMRVEAEADEAQNDDVAEEATEEAANNVCDDARTAVGAAICNAIRDALLARRD